MSSCHGVGITILLGVISIKVKLWTILILKRRIKWSGAGAEPWGAALLTLRYLEVVFCQSNTFQTLSYALAINPVPQEINKEGIKLLRSVNALHIITNNFKSCCYFSLFFFSSMEIWYNFAYISLPFFFYLFIHDNIGNFWCVHSGVAIFIY